MLQMRGARRTPPCCQFQRSGQGDDHAGLNARWLCAERAVNRLLPSQQPRRADDPAVGSPNSQAGERANGEML